MKQYIITLCKGLAMGACDVVPGVSGGTIAFITGIYDRLIDALHAFDSNFFKYVLQLKRKSAWEKIDGGFLLSLFSGVIIAILSLAKAIEYGLEHHPVAIWGFFFGLILVSALFLLKTITHKTWKTRTLIVVGGAIGGLISQLPIIQSSGADLLSIGFAGMIAIVAMILPGISGSYILLIIGKYTVILATLTTLMDAIATGDSQLALTSASTILIFILGAIVGLILFAKVLHRIKSKYYDAMMAVLTGFMLGALIKVRPRQKVLTTYIDRHGVEQAGQTAAILPKTIESTATGTVAILIGIIVVRGIHFLAMRYAKKH